MKYTRQELIDKKIVIQCHSKEQADKLVDLLNIEVRIGYESCTGWNVLHLYEGAVKPDFIHEIRFSEDIKGYTIISFDEFMADEEVVKKPVEKPVEVAEPVAVKLPDMDDLDKRLDELTPQVINEATAAFDRFLKEWNALHKKAMKVKSIKSLDSLTKKVNELL
jgi:hypothetical protein